MSKSQPVSEGESPETPLAIPRDPKKNPAYPQRVHLLEKPKWLAVLAGIETRLVDPRQKLSILGTNAKRPALERIYAQMLGARDQVADAVKRLPQETGDLYEEDKHRVEEAVASLDRLFDRWKTQITSIEN